MKKRCGGRRVPLNCVWGMTSQLSRELGYSRGEVDSCQYCIMMKGRGVGCGRLRKLSDGVEHSISVTVVRGRDFDTSTGVGHKHRLFFFIFI